MNEYIKKQFEELEDNRGGRELNRRDILKTRLFGGVKNHFKNQINLSNFMDGLAAIWEHFYTGVACLGLAALGIVLFPLFYLLSPVWIPIVQLYKARVIWKIYQYYLEETE